MGSTSFAGPHGRLGLHPDQQTERDALYTGVTSELATRVHQHRNGTGGAFTRRYKLKRLVYVEHHDRIEYATQREAIIKSWSRAWKVRLITANNPTWDDLYEQLL